jgi:pilus assembly protein CpaE
LDELYWPEEKSILEERIEDNAVLRAIVICPDTDLSTRLEQALRAVGEITLCKTLAQYPATVDLVRTLRAHAPDVIFLSFENTEKAVQLVQFLQTEAKGMQTIAVARVVDSHVLRTIMRAGLRELLTDPFDKQTVQDALKVVQSLLGGQPAADMATDQIFSFVPSKAGVGASTLALNVSAALARKPDTRVLLSDFDLNSGMMRFLLKLQNQYSVSDAVEYAGTLDESLWPQLVTSFERLDVLHAGRVNPNIRIDPGNIRGLVEFMRRHYGALCFDHSGNLERYSLEIMQESRRILMVCTPEIPSLHLAREKLGFLKDLDVGNRIGIILNRTTKKPMFNKEQVEDVLNFPVIATIGNDYHGINRAVADGTWIDAKTEMGKQCAALASLLMEQQAAAGASTAKKFLQHFALAPSELVPTRR